VETLYDHAGGDEAMHRLEELFYDTALADPILKTLFSERVPTHVDHLTWFTAESFDGPDRFTQSVGFQHIIDVHRHLNITDEQRERFVALYLEALDEAGLPTTDPSATQFARTSSSARTSRSKTRRPRPTPTCIPSAPFHIGSGRRRPDLARTADTASASDRARRLGVPSVPGRLHARQRLAGLKPTPMARNRTVAWAKHEPFGVEFAEIEFGADRLAARGVAIGSSPFPYRLDYQLETGAEFVTSRLHVTSRGEDWRRSLDLSRDRGGA
jgi:hemoglobin